LVVAGKPIPNKVIVNLMLNVLPPSYENLAVNIFGQVVLPTQEGLIDRLLNEKHYEQGSHDEQLWERSWELR
jgi:hypothetical protein